MELKLKIEYQQVLEIIRQLPMNQVAKLLVDTKRILEEEKGEQLENADFQSFLLSAPTMTKEQYETFVENRKAFNQWRQN